MNKLTKTSLGYSREKVEADPSNKSLNGPHKSNQDYQISLSNSEYVNVCPSCPKRRGDQVKVLTILRRIAKTNLLWPAKPRELQ